MRSAKNEKHTKSDCLENRNNYLKIETPLKTPITPKCIDTDSVIKKITSSLKKTDCMPYLSKTKLRNIEQWLKYNDVEIVRTPPFANLSITSKNLENEIPLEKNKEKETHYTDSTIDSDVEDVLKAVYGDDWVKKKNNEVKCKTLPRRILREKFTPTTDLKKVAANSKQSFRRLILSGEESDLVCKDEEEFCQESSFISGVQMIDLDDSNDLSDHEKVKVLKKQMADTKEIQIRMSNELAHLNISKNKNLIPKNFPKVRDKQANSPAVTLKKKTFLASLSVSTPTSRCHPEAKYFKINFKTKKEELVRKLYKLYNSEVFENKLADDMNFSWNVKLRGTAGYCYNKRITKSTGEVLRISRIEFSTKIIDRADRLRDTMIHELCHAACWVLDGILDGHGSVWNDWATKAMNRFPELPKIRRCHNYDIVAKYIYRCTGCGYSIKRHSKSINTERKRCGYCYGILELLLNKKLKGKIFRALFF